MSYPFVQLPHSLELLEHDTARVSSNKPEFVKFNKHEFTSCRPENKIPNTESPTTKRSGPTILPPAFPVISPLYNFTQSIPTTTGVANETSPPSIVSLDEITPTGLAFPLFSNNVDSHSTALSYMYPAQRGFVSPPPSVQITNFTQPYQGGMGLNPIPQTLSQSMNGGIGLVNPLSMVSAIPPTPTAVPPPTKPVSSTTFTTNSLPLHNREDGQWLDITAYLNLPQAKAAKELNIPTSSLSKRWKESARNRKWPYRAVCRLDKEIMTLMYNIPPGGALPPEIEEKLSRLLKERQEHLKPVIIRF
eukprot:TRINITY_DN17863_c0_g1_i1.p1 TRINITY_DN17863_c0_g1~~TRINITY_DN17863_c0_g1_i1.p1  ORF type:complete len:304 (+),score=41.72 TRINITY_DN17863_c0_g1_i1:56-967(+)